MSSRFTKLLVAGACAVAIAACSNATQTSLVGQSVGDFQLADHAGVAHTLKYNPETSAVVIVAQKNGDEASRAAASELARLQEKYPDATFMMLNSDAADGRDAIAAEYAENGYAVPILDDNYQLIGDSLGVSYTGEAVLIEPKTWTVAFNGPTGAELDAALANVTAGEPIAVASAKGKGTEVAFDDSAAHADISFAHDVAPILMENCVDCHREGGIGPFQMSSYEVIKGFSPMIREAIRTDRMPPYNADTAIGKFQQNFNLSEGETKTLIRWIEAGAERGEGEDPLLAGVTPRADWPMGEPDLVVNIPPYDIPASGIIDYIVPAVANPSTEGKWLKMTTFKAGARQGVHHILGGWLPKMPEEGAGFSQDVSLGSYAVGAETSESPDDWATYVPAGGALSFQMHYTAFGKAVTDASQIGLYFQDEAPEKLMRQYVLLDPTIVIEPNQARHHEMTYARIPADMEMYGAAPHAHFRGFSSKLTAIYPDGTKEVLLNLPKYDFNWQREYIFDELKLIPAGTVLVADYLYDNSAANPVIEDPEREVQWGDQSFDEMLYTQIRYRWVDETSDNVRDDLQQQLESQLLLAAVDDNMNGKWELAEIKSDMIQPFKDNFAAFDTDQDGSLNPEEIGAAQKAMQEQARARRRQSAGGQQ